MASVLTGSVALRSAPKVNASAAVNLRTHPASLAAHRRKPKTTHEMIVPITEKRRMGCSCLRKCLAFISKPAAKMMGGCDRCMKGVEGERCLGVVNETVVLGKDMCKQVCWMKVFLYMHNMRAKVRRRRTRRKQKKLVGLRKAGSNSTSS